MRNGFVHFGTPAEGRWVHLRILMIRHRPHAFRDPNLTSNNTVIVGGGYSEMVQFRRL